jgi:hypothetical protein
LVELLCVLGICAVLLGLLLPVVAQAQARARASVCANNLARVHQGLRAYASDYNDYLPRDYLYTIGHPHFGAAASRYLGASLPLTWEAVSQVKALRCPSSAFQDVSTTYMMNALAFGHPEGFVESRGVHKWSAIKANLSRLPLLLDTPPGGIGSCYGCAYGPDDLYCEFLAGITNPWHLDESRRCQFVGHHAHGQYRCNVLMAAGNVEMTDTRKLPLEQYDDGIRP